jgi:hypothetical protein
MAMIGKSGEGKSGISKTSQMAVDHASNWSVAEAYTNQVDYCRGNDAKITARIVAAIQAQLMGPNAGAFITKIRDWPGKAMADGLPLRSAGALHGLQLSGRAPELAPIYRDEPADDNAIIAHAVRQHEPFLLPWLDGPPQTNEAGRSCGFMAAMLWLAEQGLPLRFECLEIGSSAGINLMIDRYHYDLGGVQVGPANAAMRFKPEWRGAPPPDHAISLASLKGCDVAPVDLTDPAQALLLKAYIWPEHTVRFARLEAAIVAAKAKAPELVQMNAADFVEQQLARPQQAGTTRLLMHSIVWQYVPQDQQARVTAAMAAAAQQTTPERPLAWVALEGNRTLLNHGLTARYWPGGSEEVLLASTHAHGAWLEWLAA